MVNPCPPIVSVPVLGAVVRFAVTEYATEPLPLPLEPLVTEIHEADGDAVHAHPPGDVTDTDPVVAAAPTEAPAGESA
jgi:hypothetical protein